MSVLQKNTVKPFRTHSDILPETDFGPHLKDKLAPVHQANHGKVQHIGDLTSIQYIPMDSPVFPQMIEQTLGIDINDFNGTDEETRILKDNWQANTKDYTKEDILYTVNKQGWRADSMSKGDDAIMFLGDSFTFGIGVSDADVWTRKVSTKLGKKCWNLGNPGGNNQEILLVLQSFIESGYIPDQVVVMWSHPGRKLIFSDTKFNNNALHPAIDDIDSSSDYQDKVNGFIPLFSSMEDENQKAWTIMHENHMWFDFYMQRQFLLYFCASQGIKLTEMHYMKESAVFCYQIDNNPQLKPYTWPNNMCQAVPGDMGRDGLHWGPKGHHSAYINCINLIKNG
jgi:hypothetical protein|tara:strand:- start:613 stop:1629 length:1017 start_codon:yes stop_codon:yes gene_type:complete